MKPKGLFYIKNIITLTEEKEILEYLNLNGKWFKILQNTKSREVIHYGYEYPYKLEKNSKMKKIENIPEIFLNIIEKIKNKPEFCGLLKDYNFDQLIINKYEPGQGIAPHTDHTSFFDKIIACITLGSGCNIKFNRLNDNKEYNVYVEQRSLYIMSENARYKWTHSIDKQLSDKVQDEVIPRKTRISLTFRKVL